MVGWKPCRSRHFIELLPSYPSGNLARLGEYVQLSSRSLRADEHKIGRGDCACSLTVFTIPELSVAVVAIALAYIIFSLTGFGSALVAAPLLAHVMPVPIVIPLLAVLDFVASALRGIHLNKEIARDEIVVLIPAMLVGNAIGATLILLYRRVYWRWYSVYLYQHMQYMRCVGFNPFSRSLDRARHHTALLAVRVARCSVAVAFCMRCIRISGDRPLRRFERRRVLLLT